MKNNVAKIWIIQIYDVYLYHNNSISQKYILIES